MNPIERKKKQPFSRDVKVGVLLKDPKSELCRELKALPRGALVLIKAAPAKTK